MADPRVRRALRRIAAGSSHVDDGRSGVWDAAGGAELLAAVSCERLTGLAVAAAQSGALGLSPALLDDLLGRHEDQLALDLRLERLLVETVAAFDESGIVYRALEGPAARPFRIR